MSIQNSSARRRSAGRIVYAAGAVLWRPGSADSEGPVEIAVIHRPRYDDWSLPKGKVDPGETAPVGAVREILEETGHRANLGRRLLTVTYPTDSPFRGVKKVHYWAARSTGGEFTPGSEVDELIWLPVPDAMNKLDYAQDRKVLCRFAKHPADTQTVLVVRHGTEGSKAHFSGDDSKRPLDKRGRAQAEALVPQLLAFGATDVYAADRVRCHQTMEPLAAELNVTIHNEPTLTEESSYWRRLPNRATSSDARSSRRPPGPLPGGCSRFVPSSGYRCPARLPGTPCPAGSHETRIGGNIWHRHGESTSAHPDNCQQTPHKGKPSSICSAAITRSR